MKIHGSIYSGEQGKSRFIDNKKEQKKRKGEDENV